MVNIILGTILPVFKIYIINKIKAASGNRGGFFLQMWEGSYNQAGQAVKPLTLVVIMANFSHFRDYKKVSGTVAFLQQMFFGGVFDGVMEAAFL